MDGNKDEALKCLEIGKEAIEIGDRNRALKFITKARRLDPTLSVDDLLSSLDRESGESGVPPSTPNVNGSSSSAKSASNSTLKHRVSSDGSSSSSSQKTYTEEQVSLVRQIMKQKDYYEILGVEKNCSVEEIRKAYRKISLKVHPDKNQAPGSEEAFKSVSKAFQCLSDEENRKRYDVMGSDEVVYDRPATRRRTHQGFNGGFYEADVDAEEIFRNFFFGGMPGTTSTTQFGGFTFRTNMGPSVRTAENGSSGGFNIRTLIQLLPILLIILFNFMPSNEPIYSLARSYQYGHPFTTQKGVNYYVRTSNFEQEYPPNSRDRIVLEERVEKEYFSILSQNCRVELQRRNWGLAYETPHCDMLKQFEAVA